MREQEWLHEGDNEPSFIDDGEYDPFPDDPDYATYLLERSRTMRKAQRLVRCPKTPLGSSGLHYRAPSSLGRTKRVRRRTQQRRARARHLAGRFVIRSASSGIGNEGDGDPEPPWRPWQRGSVFGHKKYKEHRTAHSMSGYQEGSHHG